MDFFDNPANFLLVLGVLISVVTLLRLTLRLQRRSPETLEHRSAQAKRIANQAQQPAEDEALQIELHDSFREMSGRIDTKIRVLNELILEADQRIEELQRLYNQWGEFSSAVREGSDDGPLVVEFDRDQPHVSSPRADRILKIYLLSDSGLSAAEIAQRVSQSEADIELILGLRRRRELASQQSGHRSDEAVTE